MLVRPGEVKVYVSNNSFKKKRGIVGGGGGRERGKVDKSIKRKKSPYFVKDSTFSSVTNKITKPKLSVRV